MDKIGICSELTYKRFYDENVELLRNFLLYKYGNVQISDDITQEAFIKLWENCHKTDLSSAKNYLYTIANNLAKDNFRHERVKLKYKEHTLQTSYLDNSTNPESEMITKEYMDSLSTALASLPDRQREVFLLSRIERKSYKEIAEISGVSVKAVEKLMHKVLKKLKNLLQCIYDEK